MSIMARRPLSVPIAVLVWLLVSAAPALAQTVEGLFITFPIRSRPTRSSESRIS